MCKIAEKKTDLRNSTWNVRSFGLPDHPSNISWWRYHKIYFHMAIAQHDHFVRKSWSLRKYSNMFVQSISFWYHWLGLPGHHITDTCNYLRSCQSFRSSVSKFSSWDRKRCYLHVDSQSKMLVKLQKASTTKTFGAMSDVHPFFYDFQAFRISMRSGMCHSKCVSQLEILSNLQLQL